MDKKLKLYKNLMKVYRLCTHSRLKTRKKNHKRYHKIINIAIKKWGYVPFVEDEEE